MEGVGLDAMLARQIVEGAQSLLSCSQAFGVEFYRRSKARCLGLRLVELNQR